MSTARILVATDLPYWRNETGSHRRIFAQVHHLVRCGLTVRTFFTGPLDENDRRLIRAAGLDVEANPSDVASGETLAKSDWRLQPTGHPLPSLSNEDHEPRPATNLTLDDFRRPWLWPPFADSVKRFSPTSIVIQYVKLAWLLDALNEDQRKEIQLLIDTHDVQHRRADQFRQRGHDHWLSIDRVTETKALQAFDVLIAIQPEEAKVFRDMLPGAEIILCGHELAVPDRVSKSVTRHLSSRRAADLPIRAGYLASADAANFDAIKGFLMEAWIPHFESDQPVDIRLVVGGGVGEQIVADPEIKSRIDRNRALEQSINFIGPIQNLNDFYDQIDAVVNPVGFGAGLKIKNCEAIAYAKPLLTTPHGATGIEETLLAATTVSNCPAELMGQLIRWQLSPADFEKVSELAETCQEAARSSAGVYDELVAVLNRNV